MHSIQVKITNLNSFPIEDRFDGVLYEFKKGDMVNVPYDAACHIFGVDFSQGINRDKIFTHIQKRWGWNRSSEVKESRRKFDNIEMKIIRTATVEIPDDEGALPEPTEKTGNGDLYEAKKPLQTRRRILTPHKDEGNTEEPPAEEEVA